MGQLHNRENDTFSDSYVAEQCKTNDCDPSHPTAGNTQILSHPRSPLDDITDIDVNTPTSRYRTPTKQSPLCTPTSRYRTPTKQSPLCTPTSRYRTPHSANANVQSFKLQITKLKQNIVKLSKLNDEQSLSIEAFNDKLNRSNAILSELTNAYQHKVHQLQTLQEKYDALQMNGTRCKVQTIIDEHRCDSDGKHILLPTGYNKMTNYVQCTIFKEMDGLPGYNVLTRHCDNLSAFLDIKCGNRIDIQRCLIEQFLSSNPALMPQNEPSKLSHDQAMGFFINSGQGLTRWCGENSKLHKLIGSRIFSNEKIIRGMIWDERMETALYRLMYLEVSEAEMKHNNNNKLKECPVMITDPMELITRSLCDELNCANEVVIKERLGRKTIIVSAGLDKAEHGTTYTTLLCTRKSKNNSGSRRRPCAYMESPAIANTDNIRKLLTPIYSKLLLIKRNSSILTMKMNGEWYCCLLSCDFEHVDLLNQEFIAKHNVKPEDYNVSDTLQAELLFRRVNWNLYDYKIDKIFIFHDMEEHNNMYSSKHDLGGYCICVTESETVRSIKIMKRQTKEDNAWRYLQIGTCKLYNQNVSFNEIQSVISEHGIEYIDFNQDDIEMEITYLMYMDISDLEGNDARYCMGSHACTFFCNICHTTSCDNLCEDVQFRTIETLKDGADKYAKAKAKAIPLRGLTELQISQGVKGLAVDPYPGASRIIPPRMHCDMGVTKRLYEINEDIVSELSDFETVTKSIQAIQSQIRSAKQYNQQQIKDYNAWKYSFDNYTATRHQHHFTLNEISQYMARTKTQYHQSKAQIDQFQTKLDDIKRRMETMQSCNFKMEHTTACELYNVYRNRYYKSLEGRQCKSYRCNWESICASLSETDFYVKLKPFMGDYNAMMRIISQSKQELTNQECLTLKQLKLSLNSKWKEIQSAG
eukprot:961327_1